MILIILSKVRSSGKKSYKMSAIIWAIFGAFLLSFGSALVIIKYATRTGKMLDKDAIKKPQKMHFGDIPRAGGVGIFVGFCAFIAILSTLGEIEKEYIYLLIPATLIFFSGFWEDLNNSISPKMRLFLQTIGSVCAILLFQNCIITDIGFALPYGFGVIFTLFCIVGVVNAINIIDGFNGLASGCVILMMTSITIVAHLTGHNDIFYIALIIISATLGFFVLNFPRGRIFLGDGGAYFMGFLLAFLLVILTQTEINSSQNLAENQIKIAESRLDSALDCHESLCDSRNDKFLDSANAPQILDYAPSTHEANSSIADEFLGLCEASDTDRTQVHGGSEPKHSLKSRCETEFAKKSLKNAIFNSKVSAYYGLCIAIYPVFEVLFSIWRRRARKLQAMQPDCIHLHTLIFRRITRSNAKTSAVIWMLNAPFIFLPIFFYNDTAILIALIIIFAISYITFYKKITRFKRLFKADNLKV